MLRAALSLLAAAVGLALRLTLAIAAALFALMIHGGAALGELFADRREDRP